ncbi:RND family efflux pump membrane fusion protein [Thauera phenylacetica B4P]|uniref:RND family efflux pump membrane fusion protein n=1 Tax=Thauera phenylacetica B4P TaxID=1234382 RepID=N6ZL13_9RHOO|nr:hypothetical protein [Thauera phenylacetica]ENO95247.1 RND family efflux pump membrane fusion protein [Thauera phenylacetica B4P]
MNTRVALSLLLVAAAVQAQTPSVGWSNSYSFPGVNRRKFSGRPHADLDILPGMTSTVEIRTGSNTVLQYLTKPVTKTLSEALGER